MKTFNKKEYNKQWNAQNRERSAEYHRRWRQKDLERARLRSRKNNRKGWAPGEHEKAEAAKFFVTECAVCRSTNPRRKTGWCADHSKKTGKFRGFVCHPCNVAIGHVENYGVDRGQDISAFLKRSI